MTDQSPSQAVGWIQWPGDKRPVDPEVLVKPWFRFDDQQEAERNGACPASDLRWRHRYPDYAGMADIVAYRIVDSDGGEAVHSPAERDEATAESKPPQAALTPEVREDLKAKALNTPYQTWAAFTDDSGPKPHTNLVSMNPATRCVISLPGLHKNDVVVQFFSAIQPSAVLSLLAALEEAEARATKAEQALSALQQENERLREALKVAEHALVVTDGLRATDQTVEEFRRKIFAGVPREDLEYTLDHASELAAITAALQAPHSQGDEGNG